MTSTRSHWCIVLRLLDLSKHKLSRSDDSREFSQKDHSEEILMVFHRTEL